MSFGIKVTNYEHINRSLPNWNTPKGRYIRTKDQYDRAMKESGMVAYDGDGANASKRKEYVLSEKSKAIIQAAKQSADKKGRVRLSDKTIDAMHQIGAINKPLPPYMTLPEHYTQGGFSK